MSESCVRDPCVLEVERPQPGEAFEVDKSSIGDLCVAKTKFLQRGQTSEVDESVIGYPVGLVEAKDFQRGKAFEVNKRGIGDPIDHEFSQCGEVFEVNDSGVGDLCAAEDEYLQCGQPFEVDESLIVDASIAQIETGYASSVVLTNGRNPGFLQSNPDGAIDNVRLLLEILGLTHALYGEEFVNCSTTVVAVKPAMAGLGIVENRGQKFMAVEGDQQSLSFLSLT